MIGFVKDPDHAGEAVLRRHLLALAARTPLLAGINQRLLVDIDSLLRRGSSHVREDPGS
jgi:hypothetical protein